MKLIDVFYQGHGITDVDHIEVGEDETIGGLKAALTKKHGAAADILFFVEDRDEVLAEHIRIIDLAGPGGAKLHLHRCSSVEVAVTFAGEAVHHSFAPSTTVARVKHWAAVKKFKMTEDEAGEHVLQLAGTQDRPAPGTHVGRLAPHPICRVHFDLVPNERVNGAPCPRS